MALPGFLLAILELLGFVSADVPHPPLDLYGGLDNLSFPGVAFMRLLRPVAPAAPNTNLHWSGLYLSHGPTGSDPTWTGRTAWLRGDGWGVLPIYLGHQSTGTGAAVTHPLAAQGTTDAPLAVAQAVVAALPKDVVLYLDWEINNVPNAADIGYIANWCRAVAAAGYRPGLYAFPVVAMRMHEEVPGLFVWVINVRNTATGIGPADPAHPTFLRWALQGPGAADDPDAVAVQYLQPWVAAAPHVVGGVAQPGLGIHQWPAAFTFPMPGLAGVTYGTTITPAPPGPPVLGPGGAAFDASGHPRFDIDVSGSTVGDPSYPERRVQPGLVREGRVTALAASAAQSHVFAVRRGQVPYYGIAPPALVNVALYALSAGFTFNPWAPLGAAVRSTAAGVAEDLLLIGRSSAAAAADDAWQVCAYRGTPAGWTEESGIGGTGTPAGHRPDPLAGVTAVARSATSTDAFIVALDDSRLYNSTWTAGPPAAWSAFAAVAGVLPHRPSGMAAVSRLAGVVDVFVINDADWRLYTANSPAAGNWGALFQVGDNRVYSHPLARLAATAGADSIDVLVIGKTDADADWRLYWTYWRQATGWLDAGGAHTQAVAGATPQPLAHVAAVSRDATHVEVFYAGAADGLLYNVALDRSTNTWSAPRQVGGADIRVASVDAAVRRSADQVDVVVTSLRDQGWAAAHPMAQDTRGRGAHFTSRTAPDPGTYSALARIAQLDLS